MKALDPRETLFVSEYLKDLDPKRAAMDAGYSRTTAASKAYQWVSNGKVKPHVAAAIKQAKEARSKRTLVDADRTLLEYARVGFSDVRRLFTSDGRLIAVPDLPDDIAHVVKKVKVRIEPDKEDDNPPAYLVEIEMWDKMTALGKLADHVGMANKQAEAVDNLANALRNHARALPVSTARAVPVRSDIEDAEIVDDEVQP